MILPEKWRTPLALLALVIALVSFGTLVNPGCQEIYVRDAATGELRAATPEEQEAIIRASIEEVADVAQIVVVSGGHPELLPFIEVGKTLAGVLVAFWLGKKKGNPPIPGG